MKKISYSKYKIGINYNEENKLFKVQNRYQLQWGKCIIQINYNEENKSSIFGKIRQTSQFFKNFLFLLESPIDLF